MAEMPFHLYRLPASRMALLVLSYLWHYAGRDHFVWPSRKTIARDLQLKERTLRRYLLELRTAGLIEPACEQRGRGSYDGWWLRAQPGVRCEGEGGGHQPSEPVSEPERDTPSTHDGASAEADGAQFTTGHTRPAPNQATGHPRPPTGHTRPAPNQATGHSRPPTGHTRPLPDQAVQTTTARPATHGRSYFFKEQTINHSLWLSRSYSKPSSGCETEQEPRASFEILRRWRLHGGDPDGLGPWPTPTPPDGLPLPRLALSDKLQQRLAEDRAPIELHRAVHLVAELVEAGALPPNKWRAGYVFSGWLDELVVNALQRRAESTRTAAYDAARRKDSPPCGETASPGAMARAMAESSTLASLGTRVASAAASPSAVPHAATRRPASANHTALTDIRIRARAVADLLERDVDEVLCALGRRSLSAVEPIDAERMDAVFLALRDGASAADIAVRWTSPGDNEQSQSAEAPGAESETEALATPSVAAEPRQLPTAGHSRASAPALVAHLVQSKSLAPPHAQRRAPRRLDANDSDLANRHALTNARIGVQAVADLLDRDVADVLRALGRGSLSAVERVDAHRTDAVFVALRDGEAPDDIAARWSTDTIDVASPPPRAGAPPGSVPKKPLPSDPPPDSPSPRTEASP